MRAGLTVPMAAGGKNVGVLTLASAESGRTFTPADVELAQELARRAGTAVENARLYTERSHIARTLQTGLLPGRLPEFPGWSIATLYRPAGDENWVGGDFYDAFAVRDGWLAVVGDVAGRGADAAALTGLARHTLRTAAKLLADPLAAVGTLNEELLARDEMSLCSVAAVLLREHDGRATAEIVCAGHPLPLHVRGRHVEQVGEFSPMLGAYRVERLASPHGGARRRRRARALHRRRLRRGRRGRALRRGPPPAHRAGRDGRRRRGRPHRCGAERLRRRRAGGRHRGARRRADGRSGGSGRRERWDTRAEDAVMTAQPDPQGFLMRGSWRAGAVPSHRLELRGGTDAPNEARRLVIGLLADRVAATDLDDVEVLVSELVTNAVRHGQVGADDTLVVHLALGEDVLRVEVCDNGPGFSVPPVPSPRPGGGGNGLMLVDRLSSAWGVAGDDGTCVWFERELAPGAQVTGTVGGCCLPQTLKP